MMQYAVELKRRDICLRLGINNWGTICN